MDDDGSKTPIRTSSNFDDNDSHSDSETQLFNSGDGNESSQSTLRMDDTVVFEEAFETQVVDLAGETQVMDFGCETQVVDFGGDTQVLDDVKFIEDMETQLLDSLENEDVGDGNGEVSDSTEVLSDSDDLERKGDDLFGETEEVKCSSASKKTKRGSMEQPETTSNEQKNPGSRPKQFISVRTTSLRTSGLAAAQNAALKGSNSVSSSIPTSDQLSRKFDVINDSASAMNPGNEGDQERDLGRNNIMVNGSRNKSTYRDGNLAARKLCYDGEKEELPNGTGKDLAKFPTCNFAGLSYVGSQEPGDLSQANALDFVEKFLKENMAEFDKEIGHGKSTGGKSKCLSAVKGAQTLANKVNEKSMTDGPGVYDWDDSREDEGGGDILRRINRDISASGSLGRKPSNPGVSSLQDGAGRGMGIFNSDSKLLSQSLKVAGTSARESKRMFSRNLIEELNVECDIDCQEKLMENGAITANMPDMSDARFDTQMAAEAMEALFFGEGIANRDAEKESSSCKGKKPPSYGKRACPEDEEDLAMRQSKESGRVGDILNNTSLDSSEKHSRNARKKSKFDHVGATKSQKAKDSRCKNLEKMSGEYTGKRSERPPKRGMKSLDGCDSTTTLSEGFSLGKQHKEERASSLGPIARRTRRSVEPVARRTRQSVTASGFSDEMLSLTKSFAVNGKRTSGRGTRGSKMSNLTDSQVRKSETVKSDLNKEFEEVAALTNSKEIDTLSCPRRRRSIRILSRQFDKSDNVDDPPGSTVNPEVFQTSSRRKRSCRETRSSVKQGLDDKSSLQRSDGVVPEKAESLQGSVRPVESPTEKPKLFNSLCTTPINCKIPASDISPLCKGDEYLTESCERSKAKKSVLREIRMLSTTEPQSISPPKDLRKRRDITDVRVLYSHHLDDDVIKHQKKILARLGVSVASSMAEATHFITDHFVRTRNMLEAIASGKPVVTHLWLESCGQANCFIDEKHYILRDAKKEKEIGFSMPNSLAIASQYPLLQGLRILITPSTKPGLDIISNLVKAVGGQAVERVGRSALKDGAFPDDLLVLSCEEDYAICVPFLEQGATIYSSELLLSGIVSQKLEYDRYRLFIDHVKKTRSTIWLKKDGTKFLPVAKVNKD